MPMAATGEAEDTEVTAVGVEEGEGTEVVGMEEGREEWRTPGWILVRQFLSRILDTANLSID